MKSANYWKKRMESIEDMSHSKGVAYANNVERQFRQAQKAIDDKVERWYQRLAENNEVSLSAAKKLLNDDELEDFHMDVNEYIKKGKTLNYDDKWAKQLENASAKVHISRLEAIKLQMQQQCEELYGNMTDGLDAHLRDVYTNGYYHTAYEIQKGLNVGWAFNRLDERKIEKVINSCWTNDSKTFKARCWTNKAKLVNELNTVLAQSIIRGEDPQKAINQLAHRMKVSKYNAGRLIMTESAAISSMSQRDCFKELDVEEFEFVATLDTHTSEICRAMDGKHFKMSDYTIGLNAPPLHCFCRSCTVPYFADEESGQRAARGEDGQTYYVSSDTTYEQWKKSFVDTDDNAEIINGTSFDYERNRSGERIIRSGKTKSVDDFSTTDEVREYIKDKEYFYVTEVNGKPFNGNELIDIAKADLVSAKGIAKTLDKFYAKFPKLKGQLNSLNVAQLSSKVEGQCFFGFGRGGITLNSKFFGNYDKFARTYADEVAKGWTVQGTTCDSVLTHELGHALDDYLSNILHLNKGKYVSSDMRQTVMKACGLSVKYDSAAEVSIYGSKNPQEWFAECFAEYMDSDEPRRVAKEFGRQLEALMRKGGAL